MILYTLEGRNFSSISPIPGIRLQLAHVLRGSVTKGCIMVNADETKDTGEAV